MRSSRIALSALFLACLALSAYAQEGTPPPIETEPETDLSSNPYVKGDQTLAFNLGGFFPLSFINLYAGGADPTQCKVGASFGISYNYVVARGFSAGGEVSGATCSTTANSSFFMVPFLAKASWYFVKMPFEIVPSAAAGLTIVRYNTYTQFAPILRAGAAFLWRQSSSWSFGLDAQMWSVWNFFAKDPTDNRLGLFLDARLVAVYHL
jgi:hypothetical protein